MDPSRIRNFCIIAHIDHGKSTLADRLLEITGTVEKRKMKEQLLDTMDLERERGITIKLQPVRMTYRLQHTTYELNLIDTPGHVDFAYEVSRSLAACEGAILVVDATQGIQAQTLANVKLAEEHNLKLIPVINKIDLPNASPEDVADEVKKAFGFTDEEIIFASGKTGEGVDKILEAIIKRISSPKGSKDADLQALIFDSKYDKHQGVVAYVRVMNGSIKANEKIKFINSRAEASAIGVGYFTPELKDLGYLETGQVGYIITGLREVSRARVGDTITLSNHPAASALPGYKEIKPMVFASIFPETGDDYPVLRDAMDKLKLNDASLSYEPESIPSLGFGFRTGFLGLLHMDIVRERLTREFNLDLVLTAPSVAYVVRTHDRKESTIYNPAGLPDPAHIDILLEPWITLDIIVPERYLGGVIGLVTGRRGVYRDTSYLGPGRLNLHFEIPLANVITDFYDKLKSLSSGYASMNYDFLEYRPGDLVKLEILVASDKVDALATIIHRSLAETEGRRIVEKLKELLPKRQFAVALQAAIGGKIIARETLAAMRKDVTAGLYGGDVSRKLKVLKKQKKGKLRLKTHGRVDIPHEAFITLMKR